MPLTRVRIKRLAEGENAESWRAALEDPAWLTASHVLKEENGSWVRRATLRDREIVVKCRSLNTLSRRLKTRFGLGHGDKQWHGAEILQRIGVRTARPLAIASARTDDRMCEVLVLEYLRGKSLLEVLNEVSHSIGPKVRQQHAITKSVIETTLAMLQTGVWNRDHKPSNLIVLEGDQSAPKIAIIDCVGIREGGVYGLENEPQASLACLVIEAIGCNCPPRRALWLIALKALISSNQTVANRSQERKLLAAWIHAIDSEVQAHGDPRPKVNPLTPR